MAKALMNYLDPVLGGHEAFFEFASGIFDHKCQVIVSKILAEPAEYAA